MAQVKTIERMYQDYLEKVKLDESMMSEAQKTGTRRAFYGGTSSILVSLYSEIADLDEVPAAIELEALWQENLKFWKEQK